MPRARFLWQRNDGEGSYVKVKYRGGQGFALLAKSKVSLARARFLCQEQGLFGKSKVSLPRARFLCQEQGFFGKEMMEKEAMSK